MLKPIFTEKSTRLAKNGKYTFAVDFGLNKNQIKAELLRLLGVHVTDIKTIVNGGESGRNARGKNFTHLKTKKAIVTLKDKEKIDLFEEAKK